MRITRKSHSMIALVLVAMMLSACVVIKPPTKISRGPGWYTVKLSDTLYSIAWRYGLDYKQLARWNKIDVNAPIYPGQRLRLIKPAAVAVSGSGNTTKPAKTVEPVKSQSSVVQSTNTVTPTYVGSDPNRWRWPTQGKPLNTFLASRLDRRGIEIAGKQGQAVVAVADGQ
ncbi:MAG: LysM peptidoglycan-binding domain-containing protein, partial [Pseudomonadota bacterium]